MISTPYYEVKLILLLTFPSVGFSESNSNHFKICLLKSEFSKITGRKEVLDKWMDDSCLTFLTRRNMTRCDNTSLWVWLIPLSIPNVNKVGAFWYKRDIWLQTPQLYQYQASRAQVKTHPSSLSSLLMILMSRGLTWWANNKSLIIFRPPLRRASPGLR